MATIQDFIALQKLFKRVREAEQEHEKEQTAESLYMLNIARLDWRKKAADIEKRSKLLVS